MAATPSSTTVEIAGREVRLTNLDKPYFADDGVSKGDVVDYYRRIAEVALPHLVDRPLVLQRFPDGIDGPGFFQKNTPDHAPSWIRRVELDTVDGGTTVYSVIDDAAGLVHLANQGTIAFHTLLVGASSLGRPAEIIFDLDPSTDDLGPVRAAAAELRTVLDDLGLAPRVKSSGSRGLHVVVDVVDEGADFGLTATFARLVAEQLVPRGPFTLEHLKRDRGDRLYLDVLRNGPASHAVAPYSLRPLPGAPVAAPLEWHEALDASFQPRRITLANVFRRLGQVPDPWADPTPPISTIADALRTLTR
jgi:bifunctional non-homologous end joining protein LigD